MPGISDRLGYVNPAETPRQGPAGNGLSLPTAASASPKLLPDGGIGMGQQQQGEPQGRGDNFLKGAGESRPGGTLPEAAGGETAAGGEAAAAGGAAEGAGALADLAPLALAAL